MAKRKLARAEVMAKGKKWANQESLRARQDRIRRSLMRAGKKNKWLEVSLANPDGFEAGFLFGFWLSRVSGKASFNDADVELAKRLAASQAKSAEKEKAKSASAGGR